MTLFNDPNNEREKLALRIYELVDVINDKLLSPPKGWKGTLTFEVSKTYPPEYTPILTRSFIFGLFHEFGGSDPLKRAERAIAFELDLAHQLACLCMALRECATYGLTVSIRPLPESIAHLRVFEVVIAAPFVRRCSAARLWLLGYPIHIGQKSFVRGGSAGDRDMDVPPEVVNLKATDEWAYDPNYDFYGNSIESKIA